MKNTKKLATSFGLGFLLAFTYSVTALAGQILSVREVVAQVAKATVTIKVLASDGTGRTGSGFIVDSTGTVVTNVHVVQGAKRIAVHLNNGDVYEPSGIRVADARRDIAVLQLAAFNLPTVKLADSDLVAPGDRVVVIGTALGVLENSVTTGVISGIRVLDGSRLFQMDAAISPGNSGGPVVNDRGEVIGITVLNLTGGQSLNFAIPINYARGELSLPVQQGFAALAVSQSAGLSSENSPGVPRKWKSLSSGTIKDVQISGDIMLVETELPADAVKAGAKTWAELKKDGESWVGTTHSRLPCAFKTSSFPATYERKVCHVERTTRINALLPTKIEGVIVNDQPEAKFDCSRCEYEGGTSPQNFTWIPAAD